MNNNEQSPLKWVLCIAILAFLIGILYSYYKSSTSLRSRDLDLNKSFTLIVNASEGGNVFGAGNFTAGSEVSILAKPFAGYTFHRWEGSSQLTNSDGNTTIEIFDDMNITARFKKIETPLKLSGDKPLGIRDIEGFETSQYFENSGKKMMTLRFDAAKLEKPKVGFLRLGLAFLMVENLEIQLNLKGLTAEFIYSKINELKKQKGVFYAVAEPITVWLQKDNQLTQISSSKGKLTEGGDLRLWDGVMIKSQNETQNFDKIKIHISQSQKMICFTDLITGQIVANIQLD